MWYVHIPLINHLRVFGSTYYALHQKYIETNLVQGVVSVLLGCSNASKEYHLYDEVNKKFVVSSDVIFLKSSKAGDVVE